MFSAKTDQYFIALLKDVKVFNKKTMSINEQTIPTKFKSPICQVMTMKPHKGGIKVLTQCGVNGVLK